MRIIELTGLRWNRIILYGLVVLVMIVLSKPLLPFTLLADIDRAASGTTVVTMASVKTVAGDRFIMSHRGLDVGVRGALPSAASGNMIVCELLVTGAGQLALNAYHVMYKRTFKIYISIAGLLLGLMLIHYLVRSESCRIW